MSLERQRRPFFRAAGTGAGLVCLHSSASSSAQWRPLMERLAGRFRVVAADLYGSGKSPPWPDDRALSLDDEVDFLEPVFRVAGDRFHLIGHSYGGAVALRAALLHRERIASLVLLEPVLFGLLVADDPQQPATREIVAIRDTTAADVERGDAARAAERFVDYWTGRGAWARTPDERKQAIGNVMRKVKAEWHALFTDSTTLAAFAAIDVRTTLICGSDSPASSRGVSRLLARTLPRVTVVELPGMGHMAPITHPDVVGSAVEDHLDRVSWGAARSSGSPLPGESPAPIRPAFE